ncbi:TPA: hypothetical protein R4S70_004719 [Raoultella ornithinolytica]|uniref:hypothetical protein n=1 Tax=Raoultella ornithinolytica TaxID=54291 RepID=UPI0009499C2E|nr:hypothetical protein [Raoultella ornithinolytica]HED1507133.1 hypothetical protein [Raoultella ornithinolytica]
MHNIFRLLFRNPLFFLFCLFIPFDNTGLQDIGGIMTASPAALILLPGVFFIIISKGLRVNKTFLLCFFAVLLVSISYYFYWIFYFPELDPVFVLDRGSRYFLLYSFYFLSLYYSLQQTPDDIKAGAFLIILVVFLSVAINYIDPSLINNKSIIQYNDFISPERLRGFSLEASVFGYQIVCSILLLAVLLGWSTLWVVVITIIVAILTTSKGAALSFLICVCFYFSLKGRLVFRIFLSLCSLAFSYIIFKYYFLDALASDIDTYSSVATRGTMFVVGLKIFLFNPLGVGYFGYLPSIYDFTSGVISFIKNQFPILNFDEVYTYTILGEYKTVGTKSLILDCLIIYGVFFLIPFCIFLKKMLKSFDGKLGRNSYFLLLFVVFSNVFFISHLGSYFTPFCIAFLVILSRNETANNINHM